MTSLVPLMVIASMLATSGCARSAEQSDDGSHVRTSDTLDVSTGQLKRSVSPRGGRPVASTTTEPSPPFDGPKIKSPTPKETAEELMARYDQIVTELAADPTTASDPASRVRSEWARLVPPGSRLHVDVLGMQIDERLANGTKVLPGPEGVSYRHHVTRATSNMSGGIDFTWCGYSPGVAVDARTGAVVDDAVASTSGTGTAIGHISSGEPTWVLEDLTYLEIDTMPAGSIDPCR